MTDRRLLWGALIGGAALVIGIAIGAFFTAPYHYLRAGNGNAVFKANRYTGSVELCRPTQYGMVCESERPAKRLVPFSGALDPK